jgi:tetratricopeptide (TPR) repeat protein
MWTEEGFESDLDKIAARNFTDLSPRSAEPTDPFLLYRFRLVQLLEAFEKNDFAQSRQLATSFVPIITDYISSFDSSFLTSTKPSPPFDLMLLTYMCAQASQPSYALLVKLFQHYIRIKAAITPAMALVFLNDRNRSSEIQVPQPEALKIVQGRIDYLAEIITSLLYTSGQHQMLLSFLADFCHWDAGWNDITLGQLGRMALAAGDKLIARKYFNKVSDANQKAANEGYVAFFDGQFPDAQKKFEEAKSAAPENIEACQKYQGMFGKDPMDAAIAKKNPEERSQWPAQPK